MMKRAVLGWLFAFLFFCIPLKGAARDLPFLTLPNAYDISFSVDFEKNTVSSDKVCYTVSSNESEEASMAVMAICSSAAMVW